MKSHKNSCAQEEHCPSHLTGACRWSLITSCAEGVRPSTPAEVSLSSSESAKARAAAQVNNELHLRSHAACARPRSSSGSSRTLAEARPVRNCAVSAENRPPTSPARTTSWALPRSPTNSGYRRFFRRRATFRLAPHSFTVRGLASPASSLLVSNWLTTPKSKSRTKTLVRTLPPASRQVLAAAFSI